MQCNKVLPLSTTK